MFVGIGDYSINIDQIVFINRDADNDTSQVTFTGGSTVEWKGEDAKRLR